MIKSIITQIKNVKISWLWSTLLWFSVRQNYFRWWTQDATHRLRVR